jgi:hypothetical protein
MSAKHIQINSTGFVDYLRNKLPRKDLFCLISKDNQLVTGLRIEKIHQNKQSRHHHINTKGLQE